jgi:hypothetical protein
LLPIYYFSDGAASILLCEQAQADIDADEKKRKIEKVNKE